MPLSAAPVASEGQKVVYGIRPEHFLPGGADGVPVEVVVIEPTGSETQVVVKASGQELVCVFRERISARPGETITVTPDPNLVHLFDETSGKRLTA
jgi:multiple sugar transport system ATP-binding protein